MNTSNLFVELIVIGVGMALWIFVLAVAVLGFDPELVGAVTSSPIVGVPALALLYLFGSISDRAADSLYHAWRARPLRRKYGLTDDGVFAAARRTLVENAFLKEQYEYSRNRQRICRGWSINSFLLCGCLLALRVLQPELYPGAVLFVCGLSFLIAIACWLSWERLAATEYIRLKEYVGVRGAGETQPALSA